jgi:hypothetical protein
LIEVGTSLFASNIGSVSFVGLAGSGAVGGIGVAIYDLTVNKPILIHTLLTLNIFFNSYSTTSKGVYFLILLGWIFAPLYVHSGVSFVFTEIKKKPHQL